MNKKTDNMDMDNAYMRAEQKRQETERHATRLKEFLIYGADIPEDIQKQYGFSEDYRLYKELEEMDGRQYSEKRQKGEVPDAGKVGGRLTRAVEKAYESICGSPSRVYIEGLYKELLLLGGMTVRKDASLINTESTARLPAKPFSGRWNRHTGNWTAAFRE